MGRQEARLARQQIIDRKENKSLKELARDYTRHAQAVLAGEYGVMVRGEIARFAGKVTESRDMEQYEHLNGLVRALRSLKPGIFADVPEDESEQAAFALALVGAHKDSVQ